MGREYKRVFNVYTAWNYEKEIEDLNKQSKKGWQLVKGGCFSNKFVKNEDVCYRYQLDFQPKMEDMGRYIETFREQGWEYINTIFNGWTYFRKAYDPALPEEQYEIFTDRSSVKEMNSRWVKIATVLTVLTLVYEVVMLINLILHPTWAFMFQAVVGAFYLAFFIRGIVIMRNPDKSKNRAYDNVIFAMFFLILICDGIGYGALSGNRPHFNNNLYYDRLEPISKNLEEAMELGKMGVNYGDNYFMDLEITADAPVCFTIVNDAGEEIYSKTDSTIEEDDFRMYLSKGTYTLYVSDFSGGKLDIMCDID